MLKMILGYAACGFGVVGAGFWLAAALVAIPDKIPMATMTYGGDGNSELQTFVNAMKKQSRLNAVAAVLTGAQCILGALALVP
jgi:hypothetical protein